MIRYCLALLAALFAVPAIAAPALDPAAHPYVKLVSTSKAVYRVGETGNVVATLRNTTGSTFTGSAVISIYLNTVLVGQSTPSISIPANGTLVVTSPFTITNAGDRGYHVDVTVKNGGGSVVDDAAGAIDVQASSLAATFPRQCWMSKHDAGIDVATLLTSMVAWHCNTVQDYASYYRPEMAPPSAMASWPSLSNLTVSRVTIQNTIAQAHARSMPVLFFQATGEAYNDWPAQSVKPSLASGSFRNTCGLTNACTEADMDRSPAVGGGWNSPPQNYGWVADHLDFFNPCDAQWQQFLIGNSIRPMLQQFGFDGWQADTVGAPIQPTYDFRGNAIDTKACLGDFTTGAATRLGKPTILNNVSGWGAVDTAFAGAQPYLYRETWNFDTPYYPGLNGIVSGSAFGVRRYTNRAVVMPGYPLRTLAEGCATGAITSGCTVNGSTVQLATAMFAIAGSSWMNHADDGCIVTNVFVEGYQLPCSAPVTSRILDYKAFEVGYEHMLRDSVTDSIEPCNITAGATGGTTGVANQVYVLGKSKAGVQICHLLNLTGVSSNDWTDLNGTKEAPTPLTSVAMKFYYYGNPVSSGTNKLWWASPDVGNGAAQSLGYSTGSDGQGNFVTFTVPSLSYWDMIVLETSVTGTNLAIDARQPIRGNWYGVASAGISPAGNYASAACCKRYAGYRSVQFGSTAASSVNIIYTAAKPAVVTLRLDSSDGAVIGTCALPAGTIATATCPVTPTTGLHDVYVGFMQPVSLYGYFFQ